MKEGIIFSVAIFAMACILLWLGFCMPKENRKMIEQAYFEVQSDAIKGDIRIKQISDSCWIWNRSCWDDGDEPIYKPRVCE